MINSMDEELSSMRCNQLKSKGLSQTALGRHSSQIMKKRSANDFKSRSSKEIIKHEFNAKIYKEIFPPPLKSNSRNTINVLSDNYSDMEVNSDRPTGTSDQLDRPILNFEEVKDMQVEIHLEKQEDTQINPEINPQLVHSNSDTSLQKSLGNNEYELNFLKSGEDLRRSYIAKLIYKKVWQPSVKQKDHNTLIIFDWDDTLLCTSFLTPNGVFTEDTRISDKDLEKIKKLEFCATKILKMAIDRGDTYIITNAAPGWVEYSASRFYPQVYRLLNKVTIVSARGEYEKKHPGDSRQWKIQAFLEMLKNLDTNLVTNLICLGDSIIEMEAAHILASKFSQAYIKTIKFRESPKPEELNKQLTLVIDQFDKIFSAIKNLTIRVEKKSKDEEKSSINHNNKK